MISKVTLQKNNSNNSNQHRNVVAPVMLSSTLLGSIGGYATLKVKGIDKDADRYIKEVKDVGDKTLQESIGTLEQETFNNALKSEKYSDFMCKNVWGYSKEFKKDFQLSDFLDKEDLDKFNKELAEGKQKIQELVEKDINETKKELSQIKWKHIGVGAGIGVGIGIIILAIKIIANRSKNRAK